jgi:DNA-binding NarL/FixJ family response regulator
MEADMALKHVLLENISVMQRMLDTIYNINLTKERSFVDILHNNVHYIIFGKNELDWEKVLDLINTAYDGIVDRIKEKFPQLNESEYKVICLIYAGFKPNQITLAMNLSINTIYKKTVKIRRKLGAQRHCCLTKLINSMP